MLISKFVDVTQLLLRGLLRHIGILHLHTGFSQVNWLWALAGRKLSWLTEGWLGGLYTTYGSVHSINNF